LVLQLSFRNCCTSDVCNRMFWMLQSPIFFSQGCNHIKQTPT
jgi:hypothetical protein